MSTKPTPRKVGDRVTWAHVSRKGRNGINVSERAGTVVEVHPSFAVVRLGNGRRANVDLQSMRGPMEKNPVTEIFEGICNAIAKP